MAALNASPSEFVFPRSDGKMHNPTLKLDVVLRRALKRAGLVSGYVHKCRRCGSVPRSGHPSFGIIAARVALADFAW